MRNLFIGSALADVSLSHHLLSQQTVCQQATYTSDGAAIFEPISQLRHFSRGVLQLSIGLLSQLSPFLLPRIDREKFLEAFSCVVDGKRVSAPPWKLGPGWTGSDVEVGTEYGALLKDYFQAETLEDVARSDPSALIGLWNSDDATSQHPYNNARLTEALEEWNKHKKYQGSNIPVAILTEREGDSSFGAQLGQRRQSA